MKEIVIFGTAEIAELAKFYFEEEGKAKIAAFTVDDEYVSKDIFLKSPVIPFSELKDEFPPSEFQVHVALSYTRLNQLREEKFNQVRKIGYKLCSFISDRSVVSKNAKIGQNCLILENQTIQPRVIIGNNVMMWSGNHIGHGSVIRDHNYFASHIVLSGNCKVGERCFFGVNATIKDFTSIGDDCFISMDASVTQDLPSGSTVLGAKSTILDSKNSTAQKIKKNYFNLEAKN